MRDGFRTANVTARASVRSVVSDAGSTISVGDLVHVRINLRIYLNQTSVELQFVDVSVGGKVRHLVGIGGVLGADGDEMGVTVSGNVMSLTVSFPLRSAAFGKAAIDALSDGLRLK